jgi:hypothetical protein
VPFNIPDNQGKPIFSTKLLPGKGTLFDVTISGWGWQRQQNTIAELTFLSPKNMFLRESFFALLNPKALFWER